MSPAGCQNDFTQFSIVRSTMYTNMHRQVVMPVSGLFCTFSLAYDCVLLLVLVDSVSCFFFVSIGYQYVYYTKNVTRMPFDQPETIYLVGDEHRMSCFAFVGIEMSKLNESSFSVVPLRSVQCSSCNSECLCYATLNILFNQD